MNLKYSKANIIIASVFIVIIVLSASFFLVFFDKSFYDKSFVKYGAYDKIGVEGVRTTTDYLINYLISENSEVNKVNELSIFPEKERMHLQDVHILIRILKWIGIASLIALLVTVYFIERIEWRKILRMSAIAGFIIIAIFIVLGLNFDTFFQAFHKTLFPQGNYSFPADSLLISMFPQEFFRDYAIKMLFHAAIINLLIFFLSTSNMLSPDSEKQGNKKSIKPSRKA